MWWEFKLLLSLGIVATVLAMYRCGKPSEGGDEKSRMIQLICAGVALGIVFWFIWGPRHFWPNIIDDTLSPTPTLEK